MQPHFRPQTAPLPRQPRRCRKCHGIEPAVRFHGLSRSLCLECRAAEQRAKAARRAPVERRRRVNAGRNPNHLAWVREWPCAVARPRCGTRVHAHHVRNGTGGGTGLKPDDRWAVPLCAAHHAELHQVGAVTFEVQHGIDLRRLAERLARISPHLPHLPEEAANEP